MRFAQYRDAFMPLGVIAPLASWTPRIARAADMDAVNHAAKITSSVAAGSAVPSLGVGAVLQTLVALVVVIGLVFACAWLARRFGLQAPGRGGLVKVVAGASLGGKERVAVVEINGTWLVLGAAPGNVRLLHTLPAGTANAALLASAAAPAPDAGAPDPHAALSGTFGQRFRAALAGEASKRLFRRASADK
jgi:flagellar protein FliO/FliZ